MNEEIEKFSILGVGVSRTNLEAAAERIGQWIRSRTKTYVCIAPVSTVVDCQANAEYRGIINAAGMTTPDGMPLVWLARGMGHSAVQRTYGPDLLLKVCERGLAAGHRHYFYGGSPETIEQLMDRLQERFPGIRIVGHYSPPLLGLRENESQVVLQRMNEADPDILWVGLGSPKQDYWMSLHREVLAVPVMIGVGAAFDFIAGTKPQAPVWMRQSGLEWLFRLCCEPRRLWKRYLIGNTKFVYLLSRDWLGRKVFRKL